MGGIFNRCKSLEFLDISNFNISKVQDSKDMLSEVNNIKYINLYTFKIVKNLRY